jgi:hypothetical protein
MQREDHLAGWKYRPLKRPTNKSKKLDGSPVSTLTISGIPKQQCTTTPTAYMYVPDFFEIDQDAPFSMRAIERNLDSPQAYGSFGTTISPANPAGREPPICIANHFRMDHGKEDRPKEIFRQQRLTRPL